MSEEQSFLSSKTQAASALSLEAGKLPQILEIAFPIFLLIIAFVSYCLSLSSSGLLDEQFLAGWLKEMHRLKGSSGFSGFFFWPGFDPVDNWGFSPKILLFLCSFIFGKSLFFYKSIQVLLHFACSYLTYICAKKMGAARLTAVFAALIFSVFPLHFESVGWFGGIASVLAAFFYLLSMALFLHRNDVEPNWLKLASVSLCVLLAVGSSTSLWTLCLLFALWELMLLILPFEGERKRRDPSLFLISMLLPVMICGTYLAATGGINASLLPDLRFKNVLPFLKHLFMPVNEINWHKYSTQYRNLYIFYPFFLLLSISGAFVSRDSRRLLLYSFLSLICLSLPVLGLAMRESNLYGERWIYAASAPLAIFLATGLSGFSVLKSKLRYVGVALSSILFLIFSIFCFQHLWNENAAARNAARQLKASQKSMRIIQEKQGLPFLILRDLPTKQSIAPSYSLPVPVVFDAVSGLLSSNPIPDGRLKEELRSGRLLQSSLRWEKDLKAFIPLDIGAEKTIWPAEVSIEQFALRMRPGVEFYSNVKLSADKKELLLESNSENGPMITFESQEIGALDADYFYVDAQIDAPTSFAAPRVELQWLTRVHTDYDKNERYCYCDAIVNDAKTHRYMLSLRSNGWSSGGMPRMLALGFPAGARVRVTGVGLILKANDLALLTPSLTGVAQAGGKRFSPPYYNYPISTELGMIALSDSAEFLEADFSVEHLPQASSILIEISKPGQNFDDANSNHLSSKTYTTIRQEGRRGRVKIPISSLPACGVYNIRVIGSGPDGSLIGHFSDPISFQVPRINKEN
ncbi:MAG: hypothetical protein K2X27_07910 [Candidatus Obscuribacterales bacterium]|nr:hypothetical protein [Candidatus Obscuribacterales bacterium]